MENIENVKQFIEALDVSTNKLSLKLKPILAKSLDEQVASIEDPVAKIKFYNNYLYVLVSVLFAYIKSVGIDTTSHPIVKELGRVKSYMNRLKELENKLKSKSNSTSEDALAARSFLQNTLGGKVNGGGAAATQSLTTPAISSGNFGKHTKFTHDDVEEKNEELKVKTIKKKNPSKGKITKPVTKGTTKSKVTKVKKTNK